MKQIKRSIAALLAAVLVFSLIPVMASAQEEAPKTVRSSVMLGASGLVNGDTLVLGYAKPDAAVREYPLEWQVLDAQKDSQGRTGGKLLISKYLLPAVEETENGNLNMDALSGVFMPESYAVLPTTLSDSAYVANLNANYISAYKGNVDCAGVYTQREDHALTAASFFALSAEEMEYYFKNSDGKLSMSSENDLLRRPYAAGYAMTDGGSRSWALRSLTKTGKTAAVVPATNDDKHTAQTGGLIAAAGEDTLSRPAFNLRSNAITFVYQTDIDPDPIAMAGTVAPSETLPQIVDAHISPTGTVSGVGEWRAALHALPTLQLQARFCNDGSYILTPPAGHSYMIGVLETDADGNVLNWGIARRNDFGIFSFTPDEGVTDLYFYSFEYDTVSGQLYTSNLVHVGDGAAKAMTLGAGHLQNGDSVSFGKMDMYVVNADNASTALASPDSNITKTAINDEYPMQNDDAVFMAAKLPEYSATYKHSTFNLMQAQMDYFEYVHDYRDYPSLLQSEYERIAHEASSAVAAANTANQKAMPSFDAIMPEQLEIHYKFMDSVAFTWTNDELTAVSGPTSFVYQQEENHAVNGARFFLLSAKEYLSADAKTRSDLGTTMLRSHIQENISMMMQPQIETVSYPSAASGDSVITVNGSYDVADVGAALGFNLRRDHIVFMYQKDAVGKDTVSASDLQEVPAYDENNDEWVLAVLDPEIHLSKNEAVLSPTQNPTIEIMGARWVMSGGGVSYLSLLVTDGAGNVKQYGRIADTNDYPENSAIPIELDYDCLDYGDRVYVINEHQKYTYMSGAYLLASEPLLIYEQKMAGEVNFSQNDYLPGETVVADLSKITVSGCEDLSATWFAFRGVETTIGEDFLWTADGTDQTVTFCTKCGLYGVKANLNAAEGVLMACNGAHEQDDFTGDTLYYGENGTDNYTWTIIGRPTAGVQTVRDKSGYAPLAWDLSTDNVLSIMRNDLTTLGSLQISGYLRYGVLGSDLADAAANINGVLFNASSETDVQVFRPSAADYQKFAEQGMTAALFASASGFDTEDNWYLRNAGTMQRCGAVDPIQQLQLKKRTNDSLTREAVNVNNKDIVFYTPADKALTFSDLSGLRAESVNEWKLTVIDPYCVEYHSFAVKRSGRTITADCSFYVNAANRYVTAWAEKDGKIVWLDSKSAADEGTYSVSVNIPDGIDFDTAYAVLRKDNGAYHSDACTAPQTTEPTEVLVEVYCNGERTDEGCVYHLFGDISKSGSVFYCGETVYVTAEAVPQNIYDINNMTVTFDDGTVEHLPNTAHLPTDNANLEFTVRGQNPVLRIYLQTQSHNIYTATEAYDENYHLISEPENKIIAPVTAHGGSTYTYTVVCKEGYYIDSITVNDKIAPMTKTVEVLRIYDDTLLPFTTYAPGEYEAIMPFDDDSVISVKYVKIPEFALMLAAVPPEGGTITASYEGTVSAGTEVTVFPQTNDGWELTGVTMQPDDGELTMLECGENGYQFSMPPKATTVIAHFAKRCEIPVEVYVDGKLSDTGCTWTLTDAEGQSSETFLQGQTVHIEAAADTGYIFDRADLSDNGTTVLQTGGEALSEDFTFSGTEPCIKIYLLTQKTNITIACQTLDVEGNEMENIGGEVDAPEEARYQQLYIYAANAFDGYCIESVTANGVPVENPDPKTITVGGGTITAYPSGDFEAHGTTEDVHYFVTFRKLAEHTITSAFTDISTETPASVTDASVVYTVNGEERTVFHAGDQVTASITCAENYAIDHAEALPETAMTQTGTYTFNFTMPDSDLNVTYFLKRLAIRSAFLHVDEDINLIYGVQVPEGFENPTATFRFMGRSYTTSDYTVGADGRYNFEFEDVTPQCIGEPVEIAVTATFNGTTYYSTNSGYSVRQYCVNMLGKTTDELLKTLLSDILVYGEKAQLYTGFKTDALVTDGVALCASTYPGLSGLHEQFIGTADADVYWRAASLCLSNNVSLELKFHASDIEGLAVTFKIGERTQTFTELTPVEGEDGTYTVTYHGILATEFDVPVSASFSRNGEMIGNTLKYSVNIYICNKQNSGEPLESLLHALYNYGESAKEYYCERVVK